MTRFEKILKDVPFTVVTGTECETIVKGEIISFNEDGDINCHSGGGWLDAKDIMDLGPFTVRPDAGKLQSRIIKAQQEIDLCQQALCLPDITL